jgi:farnesol kinase
MSPVSSLIFVLLIRISYYFLYIYAQYGVVHTLAAIFYFQTVAGIIPIVILCIGDGFADIIGRRFGKRLAGPIPWNNQKSIIGSTAFALATIPVCLFFCLQASAHGWTDDSTELLLNRIVWSTLIAAFVESLPINGWDNLTVFGAVIAVNRLIDM